MLLAIKGVLAAQGAVRSHVFDEVDTGIGGRVAEVFIAETVGYTNTTGLTPEDLADAVESVATVRIQDDVVAYIVDIVRGTRDTTALSHGASPRAAAAIAAAARARAALEGRDYVVPDDIKILALPALRHRVILSPAAEIEGRSTDDTLLDIIERTAAPR